MEHREALLALRTFLSTQILGQEKLIERLLIALLADGHMLVEGAPGLAKTKAIKELAEGIEAQFHRIQFTPDLLPADITGTEIYRPETGSFVFQQGPISTIWYWRTKSTALRPRFNRRCSKPWPNVRSASGAALMNCHRCFW
jgi:MoxR-like ATPase